MKEDIWYKFPRDIGVQWTMLTKTLGEPELFVPKQPLILPPVAADLKMILAAH